MDGAVKGPGRFLAAHPALYGLSLVGAGGAAVYGAVVASRPGARMRRVAHGLLAVQYAAELVGIVVVTERARRRQSP